MKKNSFDASILAPNQLFAAAKLSTLVNVGVAMLPRVSSFSLANKYNLASKGGIK